VAIRRPNSARVQSWPLHPFFVAIYQVFTIYATNAKAVQIDAALFVTIIALVFTALLYLFFLFISKDSKRSAIAVTFYLFLFFTYGRLYDLVIGLHISGLLIGRPKYLLTLYGAILIGATLWIFRGRWNKVYLEKSTIFLNIFSLGLLVLATLTAITNFELVAPESNKQALSGPVGAEKKRHTLHQINGQAHLPNIYFIILDSYASHRVLKRYYDWEDDAVVEAFRALGFSVNEKAWSNYPFTSLSVGATLNMRYIDGGEGFVDAKGMPGPALRSREKNKAREYFESEGYRVITDIGEHRFPDRKTSLLRGKKSLFLDDFVALVVQVSILRPILYELIANKKRQDILSTLEDLKQFEIPDRPTFIFTHIMCPHQPYIFNADGSKPKLLESIWGRFESPKRSYVGQVRFIGAQIIEVVGTLRSRDPGAIIIVQGDHGNGFVVGTHLYDRKKPPVEFLDAQFGILSAIHVPPGIVIPKDITPVNLFRYICNALFDARLEILPDRAFFTTIKTPYTFYEVTNDLKSLRNNSGKSSGN
jgi:hypothetical protein